MILTINGVEVDGCDACGCPEAACICAELEAEHRWAVAEQDYLAQLDEAERDAVNEEEARHCEHGHVTDECDICLNHILAPLVTKRLEAAAQEAADDDIPF